MSLSIKIEDWYCLHHGFTLELNPGFTAFVGPNGAGKTTLLTQIAEYAQKNDIKIWEYSNIRDGGSRAMSDYAFSGDMHRFATCAMSSEGEAVAINFSAKAQKLGVAVRKAREEKYPLIVLLDAIDSGASIDRARDLRDLFDLINREDISKGAEIYILMAVNHYELAKAPADCVHARTGKHLTFQTYDEYADFICKFAERYF